MPQVKIVWSLLLLYFVAMMVLSLWAAKWKHVDSVEDMAIAGRDVGAWLIAFSVVSTWVSSTTLLTNVGLGKSFGLSAFWLAGSFQIATIWIGYYLLPRLRRLEVITLPELVNRFWGPRHRLVTLLLVLAREIGATAGTMGAMVVVSSSLLGLDPLESLLLTCGLTIVSVVVGGMWAVLLTDAIQFFLIIIGSVWLFVVGLIHVGGVGQVAAISKTDPTLIAFTGKSGIFQLVGWFVLGFFITCGNQTLIQRGLAARNTEVVRRGFLYGGLIGLFWYMIPLATGLIAAVMYGDSVGADEAFLRMSADHLDVFSATLIIVTVFAAGNLGASINTIASNLTIDIYKAFIDNKASRRKLFWISRVNIVVAGILGATVYYMVPLMMELFWLGGRLMAAGFSPLLVGLILVPRVRRAPKTAMATLVVGSVSTLIWQILSGKSIEKGASVIVWQIDPILIGVSLAVLTLMVGTLLEVKGKRLVNQEVVSGSS